MKPAPACRSPCPIGIIRYSALVFQLFLSRFVDVSWATGLDSDDDGLTITEKPTGLSCRSPFAAHLAGTHASAGFIKGPRFADILFPYGEGDEIADALATGTAKGQRISPSCLLRVSVAVLFSVEHASRTQAGILALNRHLIDHVIGSPADFCGFTNEGLHLGIGTNRAFQRDDTVPGDDLDVMGVGRQCLICN